MAHVIDDTEKNPALMHFHQDGLMDIFLGLLLIDASFLLAGGEAATSGLGIVLLYPLLLVAKHRITAPRLPPGGGATASSEPARSPGGRRTSRWALGTLAAAGALALALMATSFLAPPPALPDGRLWATLAFLGLAVVALVGYRLGARRLIAYAALTAAVVAVGIWPGAGHTEVATAAVGALMTVVGAVLLARFLRRHPRRSPAGA